MEVDATAKADDVRAMEMADSLSARTLDLWLARGAVLTVVALQLLLVNDLTPIPRWVMPSLELAMLAPLSVATAWTLGKSRQVAAADDPSDFWATVTRYRHLVRVAFLFLTGFVSIANLIALNGLVWAILEGHAANGKSLLVDSLNIWATNLIIFALWYWNIDRRSAFFGEDAQPDFVFTQQTLPQSLTHRVFMPGFVDYLFLALHQCDCVFALRHISAHRARQIADDAAGPGLAGDDCAGGGARGRHPVVIRKPR